MSNPIIQRELISILRSRKALAMQVCPAVVFALLVILRWPTDDRVGLAGVQAQEVFRLFGYGLLATIVMLVPVFPATSVVREKTQGTLALLLNSLMGSWSIYFGKLMGVLGFAFLPLLMSLPAAAACYAMGGISFLDDLVTLYVILALLTIQYTALALLVSSYANSTDEALRATFALILLIAVVSLGPYQFLQGKPYYGFVGAAELLRCISPIPAVMEILGHGDAGSKGLVAATGVPMRFVLLTLLSTVYLMVRTATRLKQTMFDRPRPQGLITDDRSTPVRWFRRTVFLVDPQRRNKATGPLTNPVMIKEFRSRRFGRSHWMLRLVAACAMVSLLLTHAAIAGTFDWGVETIGGIMVVLQVALIVLLTPSLAAGLISSEHENGGWTLMLMTPLSASRIVRGKLISVFWPLMLTLFATLPGYAVMMWIKPILAQQISYVLICLVLTAVFSMMLSATVSSFFRRTAPATIIAYAMLVALYGGTMLFWLGRDAPFGQSVVQSALTINPMAAALTILEVPGFTQYDLVPATWWFTGGAILVCVIALGVQTWRLTRPQ